MVILGIDPGYAIVGYGLVYYDKYKFQPLGHGVITTNSKTPMPLRLLEIYNDLNEIIKKAKPDCVAVEKLFFNTNAKTAIDVAQARGVILLCLQAENIPIYEYTPLQIKQSVTGYGRAEKKQVMEMTKSILRLKEVAKPDDAADALAVCICHGHTSNIAR